MISLDHNATRDISPRVLEAMMPYLTSEWGNPSKHLSDYDKKVRPLRDELEQGILKSVSNTELNGHATLRRANTSNITFRSIDSEALLILLDQEGICASSGSACLADSDEPSHVVKAMKPESGASRQMIRFSLDAHNSADEIKAALSALQRALAMLRS